MRGPGADMEMGLTEIARALGISRRRVQDALERAFDKMRRRPVTLARFAAAVREQRVALDARTPNRPWNDIDATPYVDSAGAAYRQAYRRTHRERIRQKTAEWCAEHPGYRAPLNSPQLEQHRRRSRESMRALRARRRGKRAKSLDGRR